VQSMKGGKGGGKGLSPLSRRGLSGCGLMCTARVCGWLGGGEVGSAVPWTLRVRCTGALAGVCVCVCVCVVCMYIYMYIYL
jgi:hypothetical protein